MSKILIYDLKTEGHHIEYLHHLYLGALSSLRPERSGVEKSTTYNEYVFVVSKDFSSRSANFQWDKSDKIRFRYLENEEGTGNIIVKAFRMSRQLQRIVKEEKPQHVFLNTLMNFMPFLPFFIGKSKISGIIYMIYLHEWNTASRVSKVSNWLKYRIFANNKKIENVFILNDADSTVKLNDIWKTDKFKYLTDPYIPFEKNNIRDLRKELGIAENKKIILHLGYLEARKGTLEVLDMIEKTPFEIRNDYCVIFAGRIDSRIKDSFYKKINDLQDSIQIITKIEFLPYDYMGSLVFTADKVVLPYRIVTNSSGIIGYCAQFKTPVYVPNKGLIGKLVKDYHIGVTVDNFNSLNDLKDIEINNCNYCESHTVEAFIDDIFKNIS